MRDKTRYYEDHKYAFGSPNIPIMEPVHILLYHIQHPICKHKSEKTIMKKRSHHKNFPQKNKNKKINIKECKGHLDPDFHRIQKKFVRSINVQTHDDSFTTSVRIQNGRIIKVNGEDLKYFNEPLLSNREISELFDDSLFGCPLTQNVTFQQKF